MLVVDGVELLQVRPHHFDLTLDELRELLLRRQDELLVFGRLLQLARAMLYSKPALSTT